MKAELNLVLLCIYCGTIPVHHLTIILHSKVKHLIPFETQYNFADKLFKSAYKSRLFEKHASKYYFKITTINNTLVSFH